MRYVILFATIVFLLFSCNDSKEKIEEYKSQSRDANLMGWWHMTYIGDNVYWLFYEYNLIDYRYNSSTNNWDIFFEEYWYTKYNNLYVLETDGWMHILEDKYSYDIRNDSLFLDGSFNGIRATSPFGI